jgi:hypothetical protein
VDELDCAICHGGAPIISPGPLGPLNIMSELTKLYAHPVLTTSSSHDPAEAILVNSSRHSACPDCHNPHSSQAVSGTPTPPASEASLIGTSGVSAADGLPLVPGPAVNQYEICFKCHANSTQKPQQIALYAKYGYTPFRASQTSLSSADAYNVRLALRSSVARHNVTQPSRGTVAPSLRLNMLDLSGKPTGRLLQGAGLYLYCTDCHNNDSARVSGGTGPNGPHGSSYYHLLERRYEYDAALSPLTPGAATTGPVYSSGLSGPYAICDKCHDLDNALLSPSGTADTVFHKHYEHVVTDGTSCSTCHASHGVQGGNPTNNAHLVDFDTNIVGPNLGKLYLDTGAKGCYLTCHGVPHTPAMHY